MRLHQHQVFAAALQHNAAVRGHHKRVEFAHARDAVRHCRLMNFDTRKLWAVDAGDADDLSGVVRENKEPGAHVPARHGFRDFQFADYQRRLGCATGDQGSASRATRGALVGRP